MCVRRFCFVLIETKGEGGGGWYESFCQITTYISEVYPHDASGLVLLLWFSTCSKRKKKKKVFFAFYWIETIRKLNWSRFSHFFRVWFRGVEQRQTDAFSNRLVYSGSFLNFRPGLRKKEGRAVVLSPFDACHDRIGPVSLHKYFLEQYYYYFLLWRKKNSAMKIFSSLRIVTIWRSHCLQIFLIEEILLRPLGSWASRQ